MRRRQYLTATAVATTAGLAGCSGVLGGGGGGPSGVAKSWLQAADNGNEDKVEDLTHSDSQMSGNADAIVALYSGFDLSVDSTEVVSNEDDIAIVEVTATASREGQSEQSTNEFELRTEDGDWKVYSFGSMGGGGGGPAGVAKSWIKAANNGNEDKVEKLTHSESPMMDQMGMLLGLYEEANLSINSAEVLEENEDTATVEMEITASMDGQSETSSSEMELRTEDGNWRVYSIGSTGGGSGDLA